MLDLGAGVHQLIQHTSEVMIMLPRDEPVRRMEVPDWMGVEFAEVGVNAMALGTVAKDSTKSKDQRSVLVTSVSPVFEGERSRPIRKGT